LWRTRAYKQVLWHPDGVPGLLPGVSAVIGEMGRSVRRHTARPARARIKASTQTDWPV